MVKHRTDNKKGYNNAKLVLDNKNGKSQENKTEKHFSLQGQLTDNFIS